MITNLSALHQTRVSTHARIAYLRWLLAADVDDYTTLHAHNVSCHCGCGSLGLYPWGRQYPPIGAHHVDLDALWWFRLEEEYRQARTEYVGLDVFPAHPSTDKSLSPLDA